MKLLRPLAFLTNILMSLISLFLYFLGILLLLLALSYAAFRLAVKRGGRKVVDVDPSDWIILPEGQDESLLRAERIHPLSSVNNLRDMGGYHTVQGQRIPWGRIFRSGDLSNLSESDAAYLQNLGVTLVFDLRSTSEVETRPDLLPHDIRYIHNPVYEDEFPRLIMPVMLFRRHELGDTLGSGYTDWLEIGASAYGQLFSTLANPSNLPVLFHCTAGKDRAGIAAAILLSLLDVPDETIIADYSLTNLAFAGLYEDFQREDRLGRFRIPTVEAKIMLAANPAWIRSTLTALREKYGGTRAYLQDVAGITPDEINRIQSNILS
jgi:protein-tyrosine phosphatase